jgi:predicted nicotinamide N-methyase
MNEYLREYEFEDESVQPVKVCQHPGTELGHGATVWDAGLVLCAFLESETGRKMIKDSAVIELGAGTGIAAITASVMGAAVSVATDLEVCVPFIRQNIGLNPHVSNCKAEVLDWDKSEPSGEMYDWILCADCVYAPDTISGLTRTIEALNPSRGIIVSNERRGDESNALAEKTFIKAMYELGYAGKAVHKNVLRADWRCDDIDVIVFERSKKPSASIGA